MAERETKGIVIDIEVKTSTLSRQINQVRKEFKDLSTDIKEIEQALKINPEGLDLVDNRLQATDLALTAAKSNVEKLAVALEKLKNKGIDASTIDSYSLLSKRLAEEQQNVQNLTSRLDQMLSGFTENTDQIARLSAQAKVLDSTFNDFDTAFKFDTTNVDYAVAKFDLMKESINNTESTIKTLSSAIETGLQAGLSKTSPEISNLTAQLETNKAKLAEEKNVLNQLYNEILNSRNGFNAATVEAQNFADQIARLKETSGNIGEFLSFDPTNINALNANLEVVMNEAQASEERTRALSEAFNILGGEAKLADEEVAKIGSEYAKSAQETEQLKQAVEEAKQALIDADTGYASLIQSATELGTKYTELGTITEKLKSLMESAFSNPNEQMTVTQTRLQELDEKARVAREEFEQLNEALSIKLREGLTYADSAVVELADQTAKAAKAAEDAQKEHDDLAEKIATEGKSVSELVSKWKTLSDTFRNSKLESVRKELESSKTAMKDLATAMKIDPKGFTSTTTAVQSMKNQIQQCKDLIKVLNEEINTKKESGYSEASEDVAKLKKESAETSKYLAKLEQALYDVSYGYKSASQAIDDLTKEEKENSDATKDASEKTNDFNQKISAMTVAIGNLVAQGIRTAINAIKELGSAVLDAGLEFDEAEQSLRALYGTKATDEEFDALSEDFRQMALNSEYSATEIMEAAESLALAGYDAEQTGSAMEAIVKLSEATGESMDDLSSIVVDGLAEFGLGADSAEDFANVLAATALNTNTDITQLGEAMKYAGSVAGSFGYDVEDVAQALGSMAAQGVKGSQAGTSLRTMLTRVAANTSDCNDALEELGVEFFDSEGNANDLSETLDKLREVMAGMSTEEQAQLAYTVMGARGLTALTAIVNTSEKDWDDLAGAIENANGLVMQTAEMRLDSLYGDVAKLKNGFKEIGLSIYDELNPALRNVVASFQSFTTDTNIDTQIKRIETSFSHLGTWIANISKTFGDHANTIVRSIEGIAEGLAAIVATKAVISIVKGIASAFGALKVALTTIGELMSGAATIGTFLTSGALVPIAGAIGAIVAAIAVYKNVSKGIGEDENKSLTNLVASYDELKETHESAVENLRDTVSETEESYQKTKDLLEELDKYVDSSGHIYDGYETRVEAITSELSDNYGVQIDIVNGVIQKYDELKTSVMEAAEAQLSASLKTSVNDQYAQALEDSYELQRQMESMNDELAKSLAERAATIDDGGRLSGWNVVAESLGMTNEELDAYYSKLDEIEKLDFINQHKELWDNDSLAIQADIDGMKDSAVSYYEEMSKLSDISTLLDNGQFEEARDLFYDYTNDITETAQSTQEQLISLQNGFATQMEIMTSTTDSNARDSARNACEEYIRQLEQLGYDTTALIQQLNEQISKGNTELWNNGISSPEDYEFLNSQYYESANATALQSEADLNASLAEQKAAEQEVDAETANEYGYETQEEYATGELTAIEEKQPEVTQAAVDAALSAHQAVKEKLSYEQGRSIGANYLAGIIIGMISKREELISTAFNIANAVSGVFSSAWDMHSPSKLAQSFGEYWDEGLENGLNARLSEVKQAADGVATTVASSMARGASYMSGNGGGNSYNVTQNLSFNGSYSKRDGLSVARDLDRILGGVI